MWGEKYSVSKENFALGIKFNYKIAEVQFKLKASKSIRPFTSKCKFLNVLNVLSVLHLVLIS